MFPRLIVFVALLDVTFVVNSRRSFCCMWGVLKDIVSMPLAEPLCHDRLAT